MKDTRLKLNLECDCGCQAELVIAELDEEAELYTVGNKIGGWYASQQGILWTIKHRLKFIWFILMGKEYFLYDIVVPKRDLVEFLNNSLKELDNKQ